MKIFIRYSKGLLIFIYLLICISCTDNEYNFESGDSLCIYDGVVTSKKSTILGKYRRILVKVKNFPLDVSISHVGDATVAKSVSLVIEDKKSTKYHFDHYEKIFKNALLNGEVSADNQFRLFRLNENSK